MEANSRSASSSDTYAHPLADIVGTLIAFLTLTLPVFVIASYSSSNVPNQSEPVTYNTQNR